MNDIHQSDTSPVPAVGVVTEHDEATKHAARRTVASYASDVEETRLFLDMLALGVGE